MNFKDKIRARNNDVKQFNEIVKNEVIKVKNWDNEINTGIFKETLVLNWYISNDKEVLYKNNIPINEFEKNHNKQLETGFKIGEANIIYKGKILSLISIPFRFTASFYIAINMGYATLKETEKNNIIKPMWKLDEMKIKPIQTQVIKDKLLDKKEYFYLIAYKPAIADKEFVIMDFLNYLKTDDLTINTLDKVFKPKLLDFTKILNVELETNV
jgi:hypothetical protein